MMPEVREDLVGFSEISSGRRYSLAEAEHKFGACIYRTDRPSNLVPVFAPKASGQQEPESRLRYNLGNGNKWSQPHHVI
jgi:hypothetical protein